MDRKHRKGDGVKLDILGFHRNIQGNPLQDCVLEIMTLQSSKSLCGLLRLEEYRTVATVPIPWRDNSVGEWVRKSGSSEELDTVFMFNKPYEVTILQPTGASTPTGVMTTMLTTNSQNARQRARLVKAGQIQVRCVLKEDEDTIRSAKVMVDASKQHTQEEDQQKGFMYKVIRVPAKKKVKWGPTTYFGCPTYRSSHYADNSSKFPYSSLERTLAHISASRTSELLYSWNMYTMM
ncbi:hypothetical protein Pmani_014984 [Petrolisthes manimaculis]|uniref:Uncharacterized protein n=1 Tax=Petrolisthes manimaculis TaxID=1843537 RepID=A0AAE1PT61_9EUCA|nr:hypothetical protein Pmani_014980 [Petrolisthes manimaculis]KAK4313692.1 hypothetical protein Pmani_014981 [Petrolisthes manimaculis]KAK4313693.1 hypothetical protein Pmani_014982 [Petrolisthes manimaculis]KAK4313694.1 hypothetical protein Pmani_014983 [Petrolisthes manimaculis]KAK4313695.1 hypothetical protein Pmani_014984 [Petrolisthes manimaculis]